MKAYAVITVARQIEGEYVFIKTEKAFLSAEKADKYLNNIKSELITNEGKWKPQLISTPNGQAMCQSEVGIFEIEIEE